MAHDPLNNKINVGDEVSFSVLSYKRANLRSGTVMKIDGEILRISYTVPSYQGILLRTITRNEKFVIKAADPLNFVLS